MNHKQFDGNIFLRTIDRTCLAAVLALLFSCLYLPAWAQQGQVTIGGKVTGGDDHLPIPYVSISVGGKGVGTSTNVGGQFTLIIPAANVTDTLKFSCIGYKTRQLPINTIKNGAQLNIVLDVNTTELKEVKVAYYDAPKIIQKAIERIPENYIDHPHVLRGFYRMYAYDASKPLQLSEAVFDVYNFGYGDKHADLFRLVKARNEKNMQDFANLELAQKPNSIFEVDVVNHLSASGFLSADGLENHQFEVNGVVDFQGTEAYRIDFKEKPGTNARTFRGRMYISTKDYAFIHFQFGLSPDMLKEAAQGNFATRTLTRTANVQVGLKRDRAVVNYQLVGQKWVLANVTVDNTLHINNPDNKSLTAQVKFNYQVTAVDTQPKESFDTKIGRNESINNHASDAGSSFWKDYNIVLSDENTEEIFRRIQEINKASK